jgi:transglutaminase-like putative cysteine protease
MAPKRPQLNSEELAQLKWLLGGLLVLLSAVTVLYMEIDAWTLTAVTAAAVALVIARPTLPARVPPWVHRLAFPAIVVFFAGDLYLTKEVLPPIVRLDILLLLYRGISYRKRRDDLQIIVLGLFLIVVAGVLTVSLAFAAQILAFTACALGFLLVITLTELPPGSERATAVAPAVPVDGPPGWAVHAHWGRLLRRVREVLDWRVVALGSLLFVGVVAVSALLFLAIPRFQLENSLFLERFMTKKARTGFSDSIKFGDVTDIQQDNSVAVSVDVSDPTRIPAEPYWRMVVLDEYTESAFKISPALRRDTFSAERSDAQLRGIARARRGEPVYWTFYLEAGVSRYLPLLGTFEMLRFRERQNFRFADRLGLVALRDEPVSMTAYRVEGMTQAGVLPDPGLASRLSQPDDAKLGDMPQLKLLVSPADRAVLARVVGEITGGEKLGAQDFGVRATAWLTSRHSYLLQSRVPAGEGDALVRWLQSREPGHCELFAGSLVLLARAAGHPARVVTGFKGGSWNGFSNNFTLRNSDAHAWCEVFDTATASWRRVDPTPGALTAGAEQTGPAAAGRTARVDRSWAARLDSLRVFWYRRIVNFDQRTQEETLKAVKTATQESGRRLREALERAVTRLKAWLASPWDLARAGRWLAVLTALAGLTWLGWRFRPAMWRLLRGRHARREDPVRRKAGRWLVRLDRVEADAAVEAELQRLRYGSPAGWPEPTEVWRRARRAARNARPVSGKRSTLNA